MFLFKKNRLSIFRIFNIIVHQYFWELLLLCLAGLLFFYSLNWIITDKAPPTWDDSLYLNHVLSFTTAFGEGVKPFITSVLSVDRGRVPMGALLAVPASILFGPSEFAAVLTLNLCWFAISWGIFYIGKTIFSKKVGFISTVFTSLLPIYQGVSHIYLMDLYLATFVILTIAAIILKIKNNNKYFWLLGIFLGLGMLVKITFLIFIFVPMLTYSLYFFKQRNKKQKLLYKTIATVVIGIAIAIPYLYINMESLLEQSAWLNSPQLAALYNMKNPFSLQSFLNFLAIQFRLYMGIIIGLGGIFGILTAIRSRHFFSTEKRRFLSILAGWFIPALFVFGFGYIQDVRYFMPALPVASLLAAHFFSYNKNKSLWILVIFFPIIGITTSNFKTELGYSTPDRQYWKTAETITNLISALNKNTPQNRELLFLGGTQQYHTALFRYFVRLQNDSINFHTLPYYTQPNMTADQAINYILEQQFPAIIYKTGPAWPEFSSKNDLQIITFFESHPDMFKKVSLGIELPDGNEYFIFFPQKCRLVESIDSTEQILLQNPHDFESYLTLMSATIDKVESSTSINLYWKLRRPLPNNYTEFIHLMTEDEQLLTQKDSVFAQNCLSDLKQGNLFKESIPLSKNDLLNFSSIRIGLYSPPDLSTALEISPRYDSDWDGKRLIIEFPKKYY